jgi:hypothetical protein
MGPQRVLVVGDVNGEIAQLYKRVESIVKKTGAFDALLVAGSFFGVDGAADASWEQYRQGEMKGAWVGVAETAHLLCHLGHW